VALRVADLYGYSLHDSPIVAAAEATEASRLLSEGLHTGQKIGTIEVVNPFE